MPNPRVEPMRIVQLLLDRVEVQSDGIELRLRSEGLRSLVTEFTGATEPLPKANASEGSPPSGMSERPAVERDGDQLVIRVPMSTARASKFSTQEPLITALTMISFRPPRLLNERAHLEGDRVRTRTERAVT